MLQKLNQHGAAHIIAPLIAVVLIGAIGTAVITKSKAATAKSPCAAAPYERKGVKSACVTELQQRLNSVAGSIGLSPKLDPDGDFGAKTYAAVRLYQAKYMGSSNVDGVAGPKTWSSLMNRTKNSGVAVTKDTRDSTTPASIAYFSTTDHSNSKTIKLGDKLTLMWSAKGDPLACKLTRSGGGKTSTSTVSARASRLQSFSVAGSYKFTLTCRNTTTGQSTSSVVVISVTGATVPRQAQI